MFSGQISFYADNCVADDRLVIEYEKLATLISFVVTISQSVLSENHESASGLVGVRSISVSLGLFGRPGGGDFTLRKFVDSKLPITRDTKKFTLARTSKSVWVSTLLTGVVWRFMLNVKLLRKSWDAKRWV